MSFQSIVTLFLVWSIFVGGLSSYFVHVENEHVVFTAGSSETDASLPISVNDITRKVSMLAENILSSPVAKRYLTEADSQQLTETLADTSLESEESTSFTAQ